MGSVMIEERDPQILATPHALCKSKVEQFAIILVHR
jgi:hypothetical protein